MTLPRVDHITNIADRLNLLAAIVKTRSRASLTDANHILETISARFFNALYGWNLVNLNAELSNYPAADLADRKRRLAIQVTNAEGSAKIALTNAKAAKHGLGRDFNRLIIFFLLPKKPGFPKNFIQPSAGPQIETLDIADLLKELQERTDVDSLAKAAKVLEEELGKLPSADAERVRRAAPRGYAAPFQVPALGDQYVERKSMTNGLCEKLLALNDSGLPIVTRAALYGIGGIGKTVTASAFSRIDSVRKRFPDGVLWVTLGQNPDVTQRISDWGRALHDPELTAVGYVDEIGGTNRLRTLLNEKACLLVVDDVWQAAHVRPFLVGGPRCLLLITTRISEIGEEIGASTIELNAMSLVEAQALVEKWSGAVGEGDRENAEWLMREVGYLPLALELVGAQVRKLGGWNPYRRRWDSQKLKSLKRGRRSHGRHDNLWDSLELSVATLSEEDRANYFSLGVFQEDTPFTSGACAALWRYTDDEAADLLTDLAGQALLQKRTEFVPTRYAFHDLFHEFVVDHLGNEGRTQVNRTLVEGYRDQCNGEWHNGPDDGYFFEHLAGHLEAAGQASELYKLIDRRWMEAQARRVHSHRPFASDLGKALAAAASETPPNLSQMVRATIVRSTLGSLASRLDPETLGALARIGQIDRARGHAELIQEPAKRSHAYRLIGEALLARGEVHDARGVLQDALLAARSAEPVHRRAISLADLVGSIADAGEPDLAHRVAADAETAARSEKHEYFIPDLLIRCARAHARIGNTQLSDKAALTALTVVEREESRIRKLAFLVRLEAVFIRTGNLDRASEVEAKGTALFEEVNDAITNDDYYVSSFEAAELSEAFLEAEDVDDALIIAERWVGRSWEGAGLLASAASALTAAGELERAVRIADQSAEMVVELFKSDQPPYLLRPMTDSLGYVTQALASVGREEKAIELAVAASDVEAKSHSLGTIALTLANSNRFEGARRAAEASLVASHRLIDGSISKASLLAAAATALNAAGKKAEAIEIASEAVFLTKNWKDDNWQETGVLLVLVGVLAELGDVAEASGLIDRLPDDGKKAEGLIQLIRKCSRTPDQARDLAMRAAQNVSDITDAAKAEALAGVGSALIDAGLKTEAAELAAQAVVAASVMDDPNRGPADALSEAAQTFARVGRLDEAREVAEKISAHANENFSRTLSRKARALSVLAEALEAAGEHERAVSTAHAALASAREALTDHVSMYMFAPEALNVAANALIRVGDRDSASKASRQTLDLALDRLRELGT